MMNENDALLILKSFDGEEYGEDYLSNLYVTLSKGFHGGMIEKVEITFNDSKKAVYLPA